MREVILQSIPLDCSRYIEVFGGGGTILLSKTPHKFEVYNDYNSDLVNMFLCIRDRPLSFFKSAGFLPINSRQEFKVLQDFLNRTEPDWYNINKEIQTAKAEFNEQDSEQLVNIFTKKAELYDVERAVAFYKVIRYSYGSTGKSFGGQPVNLANTIEDIYAISKRLRNVVIECKDFENLIDLQDRAGTFMYMDPPYVDTEGYYDTGFGKEDHIRLYKCIRDVKHAKILLSYNNCEFIKELYHNYTIVERTRLHSLAQRFNAGSRFGELLIANYDINERRKNEPVQLSLLGVDDTYERDYLQDYRQKRANNHTVFISHGLKDYR